MSRLPCWCSFGPGWAHHERHCPVDLGYVPCEDCGHRRCTCKKLPLTTITQDPWKES